MIFVCPDQSGFNQQQSKDIARKDKKTEQQMNEDIIMSSQIFLYLSIITEEIYNNGNWACPQLCYTNIS
jgi:hypothetical protein